LAVSRIISLLTALHFQMRAETLYATRQPFDLVKSM
jgi:hypothetical protein